MLKKANTPRNGGSSAVKSTGDIRLFKVLAVQTDGVVVEYADGKTSGRAFLEATPQFVEQKNKSPNFMAKSTGNQMHEKFYMALMRPTSNPEHQYRKEMDTLSAKLFPRNGTKTVEGFGELTKMALGGGFTVFARAETQKKDPFDDNITKTTPSDTVIQGFTRIVHDNEAVNKVTGDKGSVWAEITTERGHPTDLNALFDEMRTVAASKKGSNLFVRILDENGANDMHTSVYPGKKMDEVEEEISSIRDLNLPLNQVASWEIHPRVYLRQEFLVSATDGPSKLERLRRDAAYTYGLNLEEKPIECDAVTVKRDGTERRVAGESFALPMAWSLTMYANESTGGEWQAGAVRSVVPMSGTQVHSKQLFMTPAQRENALSTNAPAPQDDVPTPAVGEQQAPSAPAVQAGGDMDFGFGNS